MISWLFPSRRFLDPPPSPINFLRAHIQHMEKVGHVAAAPGPLACPSRSARPRKARGPNQTLTKLLKNEKNGHVQN